MADKFSDLYISFQKRVAPTRGPLSSAKYNANMDEIAHDLAQVATQWNSVLLPLVETLPNQLGSDLLDAYADGLDGRTLLVSADATGVYDSEFYNAAQVRPYSIYEQFSQIYDSIEELETHVESQIGEIDISAAQVPITDTGGLYVSNNVESALAEVMTAVNSISVGALDLSNVAQHYTLSADNSWDIGSSSKRLHAIYVGPSSFHINSKVGDGAEAVEKQFTISVNTSSPTDKGKLEIKDGSTVLISMDNTGVSLPAGTSTELDELDDVTLTAEAEGEVLQFDGADWVNASLVGFLDINDLGDATISSPVSGQNLFYNGSTWVNGCPLVDDLADVTITSPTEGDFLRRSGGVWKNTTTDLDDLSDVEVTSPVSGQNVFYNGSSWVNGRPLVDDLADVVVTTPIEGDVLKRSGGIWVNSTVTVDELSDVTLDAPASGNILSHDGDDWKNVFFGPPRMTTTQRDALGAIDDGAMVFNLDTFTFQGMASGTWVDLNTWD